MRIDSAIGVLAQLADDELFEEVSQGIEYLVAHISILNSGAEFLHSGDNLRGSKILWHVAQEESAKVLILLDAIRCPKNRSRELSETLKCFYDHLAKGVYAEICDLRFDGFLELKNYISDVRQPYYLDGPAGFDWVFRNRIEDLRERNMYVDFVRGISEIDGVGESQFWSVPFDVTESAGIALPYMRSNAVDLVLALNKCGIASAHALRIVAERWRGFDPDSEMLLTDLIDKNIQTCQSVLDIGTGEMDELRPVDVDRIKLWPYPLWSVKLRGETPNAKATALAELRKTRKLKVLELRRIEARKEPPPAISTEKVQQLYQMYEAVQAERDARAGSASRGGGKRSLTLKDWDVPARRKLTAALRRLTEEERIALIALAWFSRVRIADWPSVYENARERGVGLDENYIAGLGTQWLLGFARWRAKPGDWHAG